jgi:hypothetical protein
MKELKFKIVNSSGYLMFLILPQIPNLPKKRREEKNFSTFSFSTTYAAFALSISYNFLSYFPCATHAFPSCGLIL